MWLFLPTFSRNILKKIFLKILGLFLSQFITLDLLNSLLRRLLSTQFTIRKFKIAYFYATFYFFRFKLSHSNLKNFLSRFLYVLRRKNITMGKKLNKFGSNSSNGNNPATSDIRPEPVIVSPSIRDAGPVQYKVGFSSRKASIKIPEGYLVKSDEFEAFFLSQPVLTIFFFHFEVVIVLIKRWSMTTLTSCSVLFRPHFESDFSGAPSIKFLASCLCASYFSRVLYRFFFELNSSIASSPLSREICLCAMFFSRLANKIIIELYVALCLFFVRFRAFTFQRTIESSLSYSLFTCCFCPLDLLFALQCSASLSPFSSTLKYHFSSLELYSIKVYFFLAHVLLLFRVAFLLFSLLGNLGKLKYDYG